MTTIEEDGSGQAPQLLDAICTSAQRVLALAPRPPGRLRIEVGGASLELEWPETAPEGAAEVLVLPAAVAPVLPVADPGTFSVTAPTVGTFHHASEPGAAPFVKAGDAVEAGQQVGILEVMKLMTPVEAPRAGTVVELLVPNGTAVEYGQPLLTCAVKER